MSDVVTVPEQEIRRISHWSTNDKVFALIKPQLANGPRVVDVGAGEGFFSKRLGDYLKAAGKSPQEYLAACDLFPDHFRYRDIECDPVSIDGVLPYADNTFDVVCSVEVIEHLEDQFFFTRELHRIVKPGGVVIITTPNVLNINSRLRNLHSGFAVLFDPLPLSSNDPVHTAGHIHPVSWYYLAYMLARAGFQDISVEYDRLKNSARGLLPFTWWYVSIANWFFRRRLHNRNARVEEENEHALREINSINMLISRSVIAIARKAAVRAQAQPT